MTVEVASFISQFDQTLPTSTDLRSEGDNHMRLIKAVLQNQFPGLTRQIYLQGGLLVKAADYTILAADGGKVLVATPAAKMTFTLPILAAGDAGWWVEIIKTTNDNFPVLTASAGGSTIFRSNQLSLTLVRTSVVGFRYRFEWMGTFWLGSRANNLPIGSLVPFNGATLPKGFEWPNGQVLANVALDYPDYNAAVGSGATPDLRGRHIITLDNLGGAAAGRVGAIINGTAVGNVGGTETVTLAANQIPSITSANLAAINLSVTGNALNTSTDTGSVRDDGGNKFAFVTVRVPTAVVSTGQIAIGAASVTSNNTGGLAHSNLSPAITMSSLLIVE